MELCEKLTKSRQLKHGSSTCPMLTAIIDKFSIITIEVGKKLLGIKRENRNNLFEVDYNGTSDVVRPF